MKIKIFMWLVDANAILTKDNLSRKIGREIKDVSSAIFLKV
jgi:hypothetical protein